MKETALTEAVNDIIEIKLSAIDEFLEEIVEPIENVGNPEKLIGRPYNTWTPEDMQRLITIYGSAPDSPLQKFIFNREYQHLIELEQGV